MKIKYLLCGLDDAAYDSAEIHIFDTIEEAEKFRNEDFEEFIGEMSGVYKNISIYVKNKRRRDLTWSDTFGGEQFFITEILETVANDGDFICVFHHAYDGVDFDIIKVGTYEECQQAVYEDIAQYEDSELLDDFGDHFVYDMGNEWFVYDIIKVD